MGKKDRRNKYDVSLIIFVTENFFKMNFNSQSGYIIKDLERVKKIQYQKRDLNMYDLFDNKMHTRYSIPMKNTTQVQNQTPINTKNHSKNENNYDVKKLTSCFSASAVARPYFLPKMIKRIAAKLRDEKGHHL